MPPSHPRVELLASAAWLAENLGRSGVRVVDCRWRPDGSAEALFDSGHITGAGRLDWSADLVDPEGQGARPLGGPETIAKAAGQAGIGDGSVAVLYDDSAALYASRVWWSLRAYGFSSARILDGGYGAWQADRGATESGGPASATATFTPKADLRAMVSAAEVRAALDDPRVDIVDARSPAEYRGQEGNAVRLGHIPGARNVPAVLLTVPGSGVFRSFQALERLVGDAKLHRARRALVYGGSGVGATKLAFTLALLGFDDIAVYDAGWPEWGERTDLPIER